MSQPRICISPDLSLPLGLITETTAIIGRRGSGKTNTGVVIAEDMLAAGLQTVIFDPLDVWYGLKSSMTGKSAGLPIVIMGGPHGDLPLRDIDGTLIADFVVESSTPVILSLRELSKTKQRRFVADFAERLYNRKGEASHRSPLMVMIDEASTFVPQRVDGANARMVGAIESLVRRGRASGIGVMLIDQRPASVNKDVLTQCELLIAHQTTGPQDRKALDSWIEAHDDRDQAKEFRDTLAGLTLGEAWFWSPSIFDLFQRVQVRARRTFDSSKTPKVGEIPIEPKKIAAVDLEALKEKMSATIKEKAENDPVILHERIEDLEEKLAAAPTSDNLSEVTDLKQWVDTLAGKLDIADIYAKNTTAAHQALRRVLDKIGGNLIEMMDDIGTALENYPALDLPGIPETEQELPHHPPDYGLDQSGVCLNNFQVGAESTNGIKLTGGRMRMLAILAGLSPRRLTETQWATLAKLRKSGGTWGTYRQQLKKANLVIAGKHENYATPPGISAGGGRVSRNSNQMLEMWSKGIGGGPARLLNAIAESGPFDNRAAFAEFVELAPEGGTFTCYMGILSRNELLDPSALPAITLNPVWFGSIDKN